jgi:hypothetical protein
MTRHHRARIRPSDVAVVLAAVAIAATLGALVTYGILVALDR